MKKALKIGGIAALIFLAVLFVAFCVSAAYFIKVSSSVRFDSEKLINTNLKINVFGLDKQPISSKNSFNEKHIKLETVPSSVVDAFISIEDKKFYSHSGTNPSRMVKAMAKNILSGKLKEGASTISQQLIKNTHLSGEKTFNRKIKEISLARQMEKKLTKQEILENYLNIIYFGNNTYGIENAANLYFSCSANELSLSQGACLAGLIKSPSWYCPIKNPQKCKDRRNLVLSEMCKDGKITEEILIEEKEKPLGLKVNTSLNNSNNSFCQAAINEASKILNMPAKQIALGEYNIFTNFDNSTQISLENALKNSGVEGSSSTGIVIDNKSHLITAFAANCGYNALEIKRQPGSAIKPVLVYGPAFNENIISTETQILDEPICINGYSPKNVDKNYRGYISVSDAVASSVNTAAVKILSYTGIEKSKMYAERMGIDFAPNDNGFALALGGMTYGTNIKDLSNAYTTFANNGKYFESKFVSYITNKDGKVVYKYSPVADMVLREDAAFLNLQTLVETAKSGTAKKLGSLPYMVASKTGTVGGSEGNTDCYNIALTSENTVGVWIGSTENKGLKMVGGNQPTTAVKNVFKTLYKTHTPEDFAVPTSVEKLEIDLVDLDKKHILTLANEFVPERYKKETYFSRFNKPKFASDNFTKIVPAVLTGKVENGNIILKFDAQKFLTYSIYEKTAKGDKLIKEISASDGEITYQNAKNMSSQKFYVESSLKNYETGEILASEKSNIVEFAASKNTNNHLQNTKNSKWYL